MAAPPPLPHDPRVARSRRRRHPPHQTQAPGMAVPTALSAPGEQRVHAHHVASLETPLHRRLALAFSARYRSSSSGPNGCAKNPECRPRLVTLQSPAPGPRRSVSIVRRLDRMALAAERHRRALRMRSGTKIIASADGPTAKLASITAGRPASRGVTRPAFFGSASFAEAFARLTGPRRSGPLGPRAKRSVRRRGFFDVLGGRRHRAQRAPRN